MIDPKLNEVPPNIQRTKQDAVSELSDAERSEAASRLQKVSHGLSVNDTSAANSNLSVGGRGVDTSGVSAGSGAGAGFTKVNASQGTVNEILPGERGAGTTTSANSTAQSPNAALPTSRYGDSDLNVEEVSVRAYQSWCERGCPVGSPEVDWEIAERELRNRQSRAAGL